ncbi:MAG: hypothetical protein KGR26_05160, partial [Cyanobacteria bacterium REEB65]|nr:hypothetical protein [Cyanobacteria bacterium REEB65]
MLLSAAVLTGIAGCSAGNPASSRHISWAQETGGYNQGYQQIGEGQAPMINEGQVAPPIGGGAMP